MTIYERVLAIAERQQRSITDPCEELECSCLELEERLNRLEPRAVEECANWLGISYYSFFFTEEERADARLQVLGQKAPGLWDPRLLDNK